MDYLSGTSNFSRVMEWLAGTDLGPSSIYNIRKLTDDYLFGFDVDDDDLEREHLAECAADRGAPLEDIKAFLDISLTRQVEQWDQMISCATALRDKAYFGNPLDGRDVLTYLAKTLLPSPHGTHRENSSSASGRDENVRFSSAVRRRSSEKYFKATEAKDRKALNPRSKKPTKDTRSHFWTDTQIRTPTTQDREEKRPRSKVRKAAKKKAKRLKGSSDTDYALTTPPCIGKENPSLRGTIACFRSEDHVLAPMSAENVEYHSQESMSVQNSGFLEDASQRDFDDEKGVCSPERSHPSPRHSGINDDKLPIAADPSTQKTQKAQEDEVPASQFQSLTSPLKTPKRRVLSSYFESPQNLSPRRVKSLRPPRGTVSCLPFPRLDAPQFGLVQEELADDPFRLLIAVTFLIRTSGRSALPVFWQLMEKYPTPQALATANTEDVVNTIKHLGLGINRTATIQKYARIWLEQPPRADARYAVKNYSGCMAHTASHASKALEVSDNTSASSWEIGHITCGSYAIDSWRIFCRDVLLGRAEDWKGKGREGEFQPEWMRVLPQDKELRACLRWMWMKEGWAWDPKTGEKDLLPNDLRRAVQEGRVAWDNTGELQII
ncbi:DNA glycosylase [Xylariaceae sp. FL0016]|nr:DNA glycosylase [Xylariaceae sp. FL0016]